MTKGQETYEAQIDEVVRGFILVWEKFETMLPGEMARLQNTFEGMSAEDQPVKDRDYELFYRVSSILARKQSMTMGEVSTALSAPLSRATRTADWLVARGFVERTPDKEDRRIVRVSLTPNGLTLHRLIEETIRRRVMELLAVLSVGERDDLFRLIGKVVNTMKELPEDAEAFKEPGAGGHGGSPLRH